MGGRSSGASGLAGRFGMLGWFAREGMELEWLRILLWVARGLEPSPTEADGSEGGTEVIWGEKRLVGGVLRKPEPLSVPSVSPDVRTEPSRRVWAS